MNINDINENNLKNKESKFKPQGLSRSVKSLKHVNSVSFEVFVNEDLKNEELLQEELIETPEEQEKLKNIQLQEIDAKYIQNINELILKENFENNLNLQNKNNLKLFVRMEELFSRDKSTMNISSLKKEDIDFFKKLANGTEISIQNLNTTTQNSVATMNDGTQVSYKSLDFSKGLSALIEHAHTTQKPVRLDFEGNSSVILKIDKNGKVSAEFLSSDAAMEYLIKSNLQTLKNKLESENIPYKEISYKENDKRQKNKKNDNDNDK